MKHRIKNIANRPIPVDGTDLIPESGEIVEAEITSNLEAKIKNKFFEDLGEVEKEKIDKDKEEKEELKEDMESDNKDSEKKERKKLKKEQPSDDEGED